MSDQVNRSSALITWLVGATWTLASQSAEVFMQPFFLTASLGVLLCLATHVEARAEVLTAKQIAKQLNLQGHVEGGFFRRTYASEKSLVTPGGDERLAMTSIFYLLAAESPIGHFHKNRSDIVHYFHLGDPITYHLLDEDGRYSTVVMGPDLDAGQVLQLTVPGGVWKASQIPSNGIHGYGLISEAVSPGFEYADMTLGYAEDMVRLFPQHADLVKELSHQRHSDSTQ